ncbi:MAG TPA: flagellar hook-basal body complex protein FliE [Solirubrobacteraceae bacterium]|nr:flagellar hook-basal body complex protein FliE [Solirubrobacteraceae bacterium]
MSLPGITGIPGIGLGPLGPAEWSVGSLLGAGSGPAATGAAAPTGSGTGSFSGALTNAISALDASQNTAAVASQQLATGQATNPTQAVTAVENAALSMDFASQIRNQLDQAAQTIFSTQM